MPREGILVNNPLKRITSEQVLQIHEASIQILDDPGLLSFNQKASEIFHSHGAEVTNVSGSDTPCWHVKIPESLVLDALASTPKTVKLGARNLDNILVMEGDEPRVFFITGSETNIWLDVDFSTYVKKSDSTSEIQVQNFNSGVGLLPTCATQHMSVSTLRLSMAIFGR